MMFSGTPEELAEQVRKARLLLEQIAKCLNELDGQ
jgi:archaellum component FlaC